MTCPLCGHYHDYRDCQVFTIYKNRTSQSPYRDSTPRKAELLGYMAAGMLITDSKKRILLLKEKRGKLSAYNFIGGKRGIIFDSLILPRLESPFETARRELFEEVGIFIPNDISYKEVFWFPIGKYLLFTMELDIELPITSSRWFTHNEIKEALTKQKTKIFHEHIIFQLDRIFDL